MTSFRMGIQFTVAIVAGVLLGLGCSSDKNPVTSKKPFQTSVPVTGQLVIDTGVAITAGDLEVNTMAATDPLGGDGAFATRVVKSNNFQVMIFQSKNTGDPVYMGLWNPSSDQVHASDTSTALALALFNPYLIYADSAQRRQYLEAVKASPQFGQLLTILKASYHADAVSALSYDQNPLLYQTLAILIKEVMQNLAVGQAAQGAAQVQSDPPHIEDASGSKIQFVNPSHVWYAAGIYPDGGEQMDGVTTIDRTVHIVEMHWGWPPVVLADPATTTFDLPDGYYKVVVTQGYDYSKIASLNDPKGRATLFNTAQGVMYLVDLFVGLTVEPDLVSFPRYIHISGERSYQLVQAVIRKDLSDFVVTLTKTVVDNSEEIAYWLWQSTQEQAAAHFIKAAGGILQNTCAALKLLGFLNEQAPFFWDIAFTPWEVTYFVTTSGGNIVSNTQDFAPVADFAITPPAGVIGTVFSFDASQSHDDFDALSSLQFRWDFDGDGTFDSPWSVVPTATHTFSEKGAYQVRLEVQDTKGQAGSMVRTLSVGGGAGTATHVKLFRNAIPWYEAYEPWNTDATVMALENLGFSYGTIGANTYEIVSSDRFATVTMTPGEDLVIISNDQDQTFYNDYAAAQLRFNNFLDAGGSVLWEACDLGWNEGSMAQAGVQLPGNVGIVNEFDYYNFVVMQDLPLMAGLPYQLDHNYASHEGFTGLPEGSTIYCTSSTGYPTLVEFNYGAGWIIITGQPLEHQFKYLYGNPDMEQLLPRIIAYFTGKGIAAATKLQSHQPVTLDVPAPSHRGSPSTVRSASLRPR